MRPDPARPSAPSRWNASAFPMAQSGFRRTAAVGDPSRTAGQWTPGTSWGGIRPVSDAHESRAESETEVIPAVGSGEDIARTRELPVVQEETVVTPPPVTPPPVTPPPVTPPPVTPPPSAPPAPVPAPQQPR